MNTKVTSYDALVEHIVAIANRVHQEMLDLPPRVLAAIANLPRSNHRPVFFYRKRCDMHNKWDAVIKAAGIKRMTAHSARHGFATTALQKMDPKTAAWLGGWKNSSGCSWRPTRTRPRTSP